MSDRKTVYNRILEILDDYWMSEPDELAVQISMDFLKANGETQSKHLTWANPDYVIDQSVKNISDLRASSIDFEEMFKFESKRMEYINGIAHLLEEGKVYKK